MKKFIEEFKTFITRGNVMDMAVGMIIGAAFTAIVTALSNGILKPIINWILALCLGSDGLEGAVTMLSAAYLEDGTIDLANSIYIDWGTLISAIINFLLIALVLFLIVKAFNSMKDVAGKARNIENKIEFKQKNGIKLSKKEEKYLAEKKAAEEAAAAEAANAPAPEPSTTDKLLGEILEQLKADR